jgi:predicted CXXCH cytochrome family protein
MGNTPISPPVSTPYRQSRRIWLALAAVLCLAAVSAGLTLERGRHHAKSITLAETELVRSLPRRDAKPGYATSQQCRDCHPEQYASWHASYHRQMTQVARPDTILGHFDGTVVKGAGGTHRLVRKGDELWVESRPFSDSSYPLAGADSEGITARRVVMTTGAHHMQVCWAADGQRNRLDELPVIYIRDPRPGKSRWAPLEASYISETPKGLDSRIHWNTDCILCHATGGVPGLQAAGAMRTAVAELGISCESCHGPGLEHIRRMREKTTPAQGGLRGERLAIVNPAKLHPERAAQVCGHCHAAAMFASQRIMEDFLLAGSAYRPGDDLLQTRIALLPARLSAEQNEANQKYNIAYEGSYWPDGMIRVTGREYNGLVQSACYQKGGMTCLSCHSMHDSDPDDQLSTVGRTNEACYQCHDSYREKLTAHTHHLAGSSGSECYNCHMPRTVYGLFTAIRSHQITSPSTADVLATGRPSACNLCHLDQTLDWTNRQLVEWYGHSPQELNDEQKRFSAAAVLLLKGDAAQRVLLACAAGWKPALAASGEDWLPPLLAPLLDDPSPVARLVSSWSLMSIDGRYVPDYDFAVPPKQRPAVAPEVIAAWKTRPPRDRGNLFPRVFMKPGGELDEEEVQRFVRQRDDRGLYIAE